MSFISITLLLALVLNTVLGLFVFLAKAKGVSNRYYFALVLFVSIWILTNYSVEFVSTTFEAWLLATVAYASILGIAVAFLFFCYHFPRETFLWPTAARRLVLLTAMVVGVSVFAPGWVITAIVISPWKIVTGPGVGIVFLYF